MIRALLVLMLATDLLAQSVPWQIAAVQSLPSRADMSAWWRPEIAASTNDYSGYARHISLSGGATVAKSYGLQLDGANDFAECHPLSAWKQTSLTVSAWFQTTSNAIKAVVFRGNSAAGLESWFLQGTCTSARWVVQSTLNAYTVLQGPHTHSGRWAHAAATYDGGTRVSRLYIDGTLYGSATSAAIIKTVASNQCIGAAGQPTARESFFGGSIAAVAIYSNALPAAQIRNLYEYGRHTFTP